MNLCVLLQVSLGLSTKFTWIVVIKIFAIELLSQPFLGSHLWFHIFFHSGILGPHPFFTACCFCIDITSFCNCIFIIQPALVLFICLFLYYRSDELRCCIQNLTVFSSFFYIITLIFIVDFVLKFTWWLLIKCLLNDFQCSWIICTGWFTSSITFNLAELSSG